MSEIPNLKKSDKEIFLNFIKFSNSNPTNKQRDIIYEFHLGGNMNGKYCKNACKFCIINKTARYIFPYVSRKDFKEGWELFKQYKCPMDKIQLDTQTEENSHEIKKAESNGLVYFQHGDFLGHPYVYEFLEIIHNDNYEVSCINNLLLLKKSKIDFFKEIDMKIIFTPHTFDIQKREIMYGKHKMDKVNLMIDELKDQFLGIMFLYLGDKDQVFKDIDRAFEEMPSVTKGWPGVFVGPMEYNKYLPQEIQALGQKSQRGYIKFVEELYKRYPNELANKKLFHKPLKLLTEEDFIHADALGATPYQYENIEPQLQDLKGTKLFCSSGAAYPYWKNRLQKYHDINVINTKNYSHGGSINIAAFLDIEDININIKGLGANHLILPESMFAWEVIQKTKPIENIKFDGEIHIL